MLEPAFITLQAIMTKAAEMMEHCQAIAPRVFKAMLCLSGHSPTNQSVLCGHSARLKCLSIRENMHWEQENNL